MSYDFDDHYGELQEFIERIYEDVEEDGSLRRLDILNMGETYDLPQDLQDCLRLLPSGNYARVPLCTHLNSIISSHSWSQRYGTVE